jgi:hypothetical protein
LRTWGTGREEDTDDEPVRSDGASPLGPWLPQRYATISDPDSFFSTLGQGDGAADRRPGHGTGGRRPAGEDYLAKAVNSARPQPGGGDHPAPQILLAPEPETSEDPEETGPSAASGERPLVIDRSHPLWAEVNAEQQELAQDS